MHIKPSSKRTMSQQQFGTKLCILKQLAAEI